MTDDYKKDLNGLGQRVTDVQISMGGLTEKTERNEEDIQKIFTGIGDMQKTINGMVWKVFAMVSIPSILIVISFILNFNKGN